MALKKLLTGEKGATAVLIALMAAFLAGMAALVIDGGRLYLTYSEMRSAVDTAALAGSQMLPNTDDAHEIALHYACANGLDPAQVQVNVPYQGDNTRIEVLGNKTVNFLLAPVLGYQNRSLTARAVAVYAGDRVFDYAIFSGSPEECLHLSGSSLNVTGDVHTNNDAEVTGSSQNISGVLEACGDIRVTGCDSDIGEQIENTSFVPIPQYSMNELRSKATRIFYGDQYWSGSSINLDGIVFIEGNVHISGSSIRGSGTLICTGDIHISGSGIRYETSADAVCLYAGRDLHVSGSSISVDGILYAPNGSVNLSGSSQTIKGAVIADKVKMTGSSRTIIHDTDALHALPVRIPRLVV